MEPHSFGFRSGQNTYKFCSLGWAPGSLGLDECHATSFYPSQGDGVSRHSCYTAKVLQGVTAPTPLPWPSRDAELSAGSAKAGAV